MELGASWESDSHSLGQEIYIFYLNFFLFDQEIYNLLRHPKVNYHDNVPILSQLHPFTSTASIFASTYGLPMRSPTNMLSDYSSVCISHMPLASYMSHPPHLSSFDHPKYVQQSVTSKPTNYETLC